VVGTIMRCGWGRGRKRRWKRHRQAPIVRRWWYSGATVIIALWSGNSVNWLRRWMRRKRSFSHTEFDSDFTLRATRGSGQFKSSDPVCVIGVG
jgi:hypothetical protein